MISSSSTTLLLAVATILAVSVNVGSLSVPLELTEAVIQCPDKSQCSEGSTCCLKSDGLYGCCAYKNGICCPGTHHCCPANSLCHADGCVADQSGNLNAQKLIEAVKSNKESKVNADPEPNLACPDGSSCPGLQSCCLYINKYLCCPYAYGVCCPGGLTCCPSGTTCSGSYCVHESGSTFLYMLMATQHQTNKKSKL